LKVAVFGGTGFVGSYILDELLAQGHQAKLLVRFGSESKLESFSNIESVFGDVSSLESIEETLSGCDAAINLIGLIREFPSKEITFEDLHFQSAKRVIHAAEKAGVKRFILMSANGVKPNGTPYQTSKWLAEQVLKGSTLDWTIFRPSLIFGDPRGRVEFCSQLRDDMLSLPIPAPLFHRGLIPKNAGEFEMSPIHVKNVATIFVDALSKESTFGKRYDLGGPDIFTWKQLIKQIATGVGKIKWTMPAPVFPIKMVAGMLDRFSFFPITKDQLTMLLEGNTCDSKEVFEEFKIDPIPMNKDTLNYLMNS
jgi:NADH dehydrogenase